MSQCLFSSVPALLFICELKMMVLSTWLTHYDQLTAVHDFNLLFIYLEHKVKRILALSLNWKVNIKLFNPEMGRNGSMYLQ